MNYAKPDAKAYARENFYGIWAAAQTPFDSRYEIDERGLRSNLRHWKRDLLIDGVFVGGKQGEFFSLSVAERKRLFDIAVDEANGLGFGPTMSCSDQNMDVVIELATHAQEIGADTKPLRPSSSAPRVPRRSRSFSSVAVTERS